MSEDYKKTEIYRSNVIEYPYEFGEVNSRIRFMLTTAENDDPDYPSAGAAGTNSLPRLQGYNSSLAGGHRPSHSVTGMNSLSHSAANLHARRGISARNMQQ
jgi:hypothetical protein